MNETLVEEVGDIFFIERGDGFVFACGEKEAWNTLRNRSNWQRTDFKIIGTSDGSTYKKIVSGAKAEKAAIQADMASFKDKLERYTEAEEKMLYTELLDENDPKVLRVRELKEKVKQEMTPVEKRLKEFSTDLVSKAFAAELEVAKLTPRMPKNQDVSVGDSSKNREGEILRLMGKQ